MSVDRLTADDQVMLWPDPIWPQDIGAVAVLDGSRLLDPDGRLRLEVVQQAIGSRLHLAPRVRQLLAVPRRGLGAPLWVDDPAFDLAEHVRVAPLPPPGDDASLLHTVAQLRRRRLNRSRPLWEMWFLPGLPDGRVGLFIRMHHVVADGIAGVATLSAFLEPTADAGTRAAPRGCPDRRLHQVSCSWTTPAGTPVGCAARSPGSRTRAPRSGSCGRCGPRCGSSSRETVRR